MGKSAASDYYRQNYAGSIAALHGRYNAPMRELNLLHHIYRTAGSATANHVSIPPGDDMGALRIGKQDVLVTVDQLADQVHFDLGSTPLEKIARKAITRNLSDVAAMAAVPVGMVAAASLPNDFGEARAEQLFDAMHKIAADFHCPLFGGDISMWDQRLLITITVLAEPQAIEPILRKGAQVGDCVCVTGKLGGSLLTINDYTHHLDFTPRLAQARELATQYAPHCMIDLSDGLAKDVAHLCRAADLGVSIDAARLPISDAAVAMSKQTGKPAWAHAIGDGEDYELCFTCSKDDVPVKLFDTPVQVVGKITAEPARNIRLSDGSLQSLDKFGWEHTGK